MGLETASYISQLDPANPVDTDPVGEGNDHIQQIKSVLQNSFPSPSTSAIIPNVSAQSGKFLTNNGTDTSWGTVTAYDDSTVQDNIALLGFKMAVNDSLTYFGMVDGIVDQYTDETGVDAGNSLNLTYDSSGDYYTGFVNGTTQHSWSYTGSDQTWITPANTISGDVKILGANSQNGGHAGFEGLGGIVEATIPLSASTGYTIVVGRAGTQTTGPSPATYGGGGSSNWQFSGAGCGLTGIFTGTAAIDFDNSSGNGAASQARALMIAGGGGGIGDYHYGCHGSDTWDGGDVTASGGSGTGQANTAGTQTYMAGESSGAGGGGGYNGGNGAPNSAGGNSGSNYIHPSATNIIQNTGQLHVSDPDETGVNSMGQVYITTTQQATLDITLQSVSFAAEFVPSTIRCVLFEEDIDSVVLNTDLQVYVSRDDGTTWSQITLSDEGDYETGKNILSGEVDVSGQPSGSSVKYRVVSNNLKELRIHGISLSWS